MDKAPCKGLSKPMLMDAIEVFVEVVEAMSFVRAAERLGMPTSTVSAKIARLEEQLKVTLIKRNTRQMRVTPAGRAYYERCLRAIAEIGEAEREIAAAREEPTGVLRIAALSEMAPFLLPKHVDAYLARFPNTSVELIVTNEPINTLSEQIDLAIQLEPQPGSKLIVRKFRSAQIGLWASPAYLDRKGTPQSLEELAAHALMRFTRTDGHLVLQPGNLGQVAVDQLSRLATNDFHCLLGFILGGHGIGLLPDFMGEEVSTSLSLSRVLPDIFAGCGGDICFVYPAQAFVPASVEAFIKIALGQEA